MPFRTETIIFDDDFGDLNFNLEEEAVEADKATIEKPKVKSKPKVEHKNVLGLTESETETIFAVLAGFLFVTILVGSLMGYTVWYFKQP